MDKLTNKEIDDIIRSASNDSNWYKESQSKGNMAKGLLAAVLLVLSGYTIFDAATRASVNPEDVKHVVEDRAMMENIKSKYNVPPLFNIPPSKPQAPVVNQIPQVAPPKPTAPAINTQEPTANEMFEFLKQDEGIRHKVYRDSKGHPSIGIGCKLQRPEVAKLMRQMGLSYKAVMRGQQEISDYQAKILFEHDLVTAKESARNCINNYDEQPHDIKMVLIDMAYNVGPQGIMEFRDFRKYLEQKNYKFAIRAMRNSRWFNQVPNRAKRLQEIVRNTIVPNNVPAYGPTSIADTNKNKDGLI